MASGAPSRNDTIHSFWKLMLICEPRQSSNPSNRTTPRSQPSAARRWTSDHLAPEQSLPGSTARIAAIGSSCRRCASRTAAPIAHRLGHGAVDAPLLDLRAGARRLAGRGGRAVFGADLARHPFGPLRVGTLCTMLSKPRTSTMLTGIGLQPADRGRGHLQFGIGAGHRCRCRRSGARDAPPPSAAARRWRRRSPCSSARRSACRCASPSPTRRAPGVRLSISRSCPTSGAPMLATVPPPGRRRQGRRRPSSWMRWPSL